MGNSKFFKGIVIGAAVGGLITLFDRETRDGVLNNIKTVGQKSNYYVKHPSIALNNFRKGYEQFSNQLFTGVNSTLQVLTELQELLDKVKAENNDKNPDIDK